MVFRDVQLARGLDHKGASHRTTLLIATVERLPGSLRLLQLVERTGRTHTALFACRSGGGRLVQHAAS